MSVFVESCMEFSQNFTTDPQVSDTWSSMALRLVYACHVTTLNRNRNRLADGSKPSVLSCGDTSLASRVELYRCGLIGIQNISSVGQEVPPPHLTKPDVSSAHYQLTRAAPLTVMITSYCCGGKGRCLGSIRLCRSLFYLKTLNATSWRLVYRLNAAHSADLSHL